MKAALKSAGMLIYFDLVQIIVTSIIVIAKMVTDHEWFEGISQLICGTGELDMNAVFSVEFFSELMDLAVKSVLVADIFIAIPIMYQAAKNKDELYHKLTICDVWFYIFLGVALMLSINFILDYTPIGDYESTTSFYTIDNPVLIVLTTGIIGPIVEELTFRYLICSQFTNKKVAVFVSALVFGIAHLNIIQSTYAFVVGLVLGYVYVKTNNLLASSIIHLAFNIGSLVYSYYMDVVTASGVFIIALIYISSSIIINKLERKEDICTDQPVIQ
jgi:membrane protease YdiL (CAAX protease family)